MIVKENLSTSGEDLFDELDSSVTRYFFRGIRGDGIGETNGKIGVIRS